VKLTIDIKQDAELRKAVDKAVDQVVNRLVKFRENG